MVDAGRAGSRPGFLPSVAEAGLVVVTDRRQAEAVGYRLVDVVAAAVDAGARVVLVREKDLPWSARGHVAEALARLLAPAGGALLVADDVALAKSVGAVGVHFAAGNRAFFEPEWLESNRFGSKNELVVGRSCHSVDELRAARADGAEYATFSPIWVTPSKPGYGPAVGIDGLAAACAAVPDLPVVALGGIRPGRVAVCREAGAAGVAVMGAIMAAEDPGQVVRMILTEWADAEPRTAR